MIKGIDPMVFRNVAVYYARLNLLASIPVSKAIYKLVSLHAQILLSTFYESSRLSRSWIFGKNTQLAIRGA
jgi:hypothetical protein